MPGPASLSTSSTSPDSPSTGPPHFLAAGASVVERPTKRSDMTACLCDVARSALDSVEPVLLGADNLIHPGLRRVPATESAGRSTVLGVAAPSRDLRDDRGRVVLATDDIGAV